MQDDAGAAAQPRRFPYVLAAIAGLLLLLTIVFAAVFFTSGEDASLEALSNGQRVSIDPQTGQVSGNPYTPQAAAPAAEAPLAAPGANDQPTFDVGAPEETVTETPPTNTPAPTPADDIASLVGTQNDAVETIRVEPPTGASLAPVQQDLLTQTDYGVIPASSYTQTPFSAYRRPYTVSGKTPKVALIVMGLGNQKALSEEAIKLPVNVSFSLSPYAPQIQSWMESARNTGHEAWLELSAQPADFPASDPGPLALLSDMQPEDALPRLYRTLATAAGYAGLVLPPGEVYSDTPAQARWLSEQAEKQGLGLIVAKAPLNAAAKAVFSADRRAIVTRVVDDELAPNAIRAQFEAVAEAASADGCAIALMRQTPLSLAMAQEWIDTLVRQQIALVPASVCTEGK